MVTDSICYVDYERNTCRTPRPVVWVLRCVMFSFDIFIIGRILGLHLTQGLFKICAPITDVTKYSLSKRTHKQVIKKSLAFFLLINRRHPHRWLAVISWLNYLTQAVELWNYSGQHPLRLAFTQLWIHSPYFTSIKLNPTPFSDMDSQKNLFWGLLSFNSLKVHLFIIFPLFRQRAIRFCEL